MLINMPRLKLKRGRPPTVRGPAIGDSDSRVFTCPGCSRPLPNGTWRCPGCGAKLVLGVQLHRAVGILGIGVVVGVISAGILGMTLTGGLPFGGTAAAPGATGATGAQASAGASASNGVVVLPANVPQTAVGALKGTAVVNARIVADAAALNKVLAKKGDTTAQIARALRVLAADAAQGSDMTGRMAGWADASALKKQLNGFYLSMADTARDGLQGALTDKAGYKSAGKRMVAVVKGLGAVDTASRKLAATVGVELLPLTGVPKAPAASTAPAP